eukprot:gene30986-38291_t
MFRSGMTEHQVSNRGMVDVVVPDSFVGFLRLLLYVYTDTLPDGSDGALLEDLMAADRYDIPDMKLLCENMLVPSENNWLDLLRAADLLNSQRIQLLATAYLRDNFSLLEVQEEKVDEKVEKKSSLDEKVEENSSLSQLKEEFPGLLEELFEKRKEISPLPPSQLLINQCTTQSQKEKKEHNPYVSRFVSMGWVIPIVNVGGLASKDVWTKDVWGKDVREIET